MDPLALLSDDEEDADAEAAMMKGGEDDKEESEPPTKKARPGSLDSLGLDFKDLQRAGLGLQEDEEAEKTAAKASLQNSFAKLAQDFEANQPAKPPPSPEKKPVVKAGDNAEFGCEVPPDSIEVYDEGGEAEPEPWDTFDSAEPGLTKDVVDVMRKAGFDNPMPIQAHTWPILSGGRDLIGVAKTGSGKTLAFLLPCFARLVKDGLRPKINPDSALPVQMTKQAAGPGAFSPEVLVLAPSRELAQQIEMEAKKFSAAIGIRTLAIYGGAGTRSEQLGQLRERPECVVATIGRLMDFLENEKHWFGVKTVKYLILDEADVMLGEGLSENIRKITTDVEYEQRQTMMFSATFDDEVRSLASWILKNPVEVRVGMRDPLRANKDVEQQVMIVKDDTDKDGALKNIIRKQYNVNSDNPGKVLVFAGDPDECDVLASKIKANMHGAKVETLHANKKQTDRENAITAFRNGDIPVLIATNIAGRGLDIKDVKLVVNYDPPEDGQDYVHRIGRTGRAGNKGTAITLLRRGPDGRAMIYITHVMKRTGKAVPKDLIEALKQRRGRDMSMAAEALRGLVHFENVQRGWQGNLKATG